MNYSQLVFMVSQLHRAAQKEAAGAINRHLILRNWIIGAYLVEYEQEGEDRAAYGSSLVESIARDLRSTGIKGLGVSMLRISRRFFEIYPQIRQSAIAESHQLVPSAIRQSLIADFRATPVESPTGQSPIGQLVSSTPTTEPLPTHLPAAKVMELSWTHLIEIIRLDDPWKRAFYENECLKGNWSVRQLQRQIGSLLYDRTALSTDKQAVINHARQQAQEAPALIVDLIRDPYVLEFTGLAETDRYFERGLETALLDHLQSFLLELGTGFCFEARQKRVTVGDEHDYIDLVFYHRILRCHLLIDLKIRPFQHGDAGQMNFYLNYWKTEMIAPGDQPPVGLILCTDKKETRVSYATAGLDHQLFVSRYLNVLPTEETLQRMIEQDAAVWQQQHATESQSD